MLVLSRKPGEALQIGKGITITVLEVKGKRIRLGIAAPPECEVLRAELHKLSRQPKATGEGPGA